MPSISEVVASTLELYEPNFADNIHKNHVLMNHLKENKGVKEFASFPRGYLRVPLMHALNSTVMAYSGTDVLDTTYQDTLTAAEFSAKRYNASIVITQEDADNNEGPEQIIDLLEAKIEQAEMSLAERLNLHLYKGQEDTTSRPGEDTTKQIPGFNLIAGTGSIGGIDGSTDTFWKAQVEATSETVGFARIREYINKSNNGSGGKKVSLVVTTAANYEKLVSLLTATVQYNPVMSAETKRLGQHGFPAGIEIDGVPVTWDEQCTANMVLGFNVSNYKLGVRKDRNFKVIKKAEPSDQHVSMSHIVWVGTPYTNRRASLFKLTNKSNT